MSARKLTSEQKERAFDLREAGWSYKRIADAVGVSPGCVSWHCLANGIEPPRSKPWPCKSHDTVKGPLVMTRGDHKVRRYTPDEDAAILKMEAGGARIAVIARHVGRRWNSVRGRMMVLARRDARRERG